MLRRELCASHLNIPISRIENITIYNRNAYYGTEYFNAVKKTQNLIFGALYGYLISFGNAKDLQYLNNLIKSESKEFASSHSWTLEEVQKELKHELKTK